MSEQWLSIVEFARRHNVSDMTIRRRIKNGRLQAVLREGKYFIPMTAANRKAGALESDGDELERPLAAPKAVERSERGPANHFRQQAQQPQQLQPPQQPSYSTQNQTTPIASMPTRPQPVQTTTYPSFSQAIPAQAPQYLQHQHQQGTHAGALEQLMRREVSAQNNAESPAHGRSGGQTSYSSSLIPGDVIQPLLVSAQFPVETRALLDFCDHALRKISGKERRTEEMYQQKIKTFEAKIEAKDLEIKALKEQIEDLDLLVKVLEKKAS